MNTTNPTTTVQAQPDNSARIEMPSISPYVDYSSDNYGAHALRVSIGRITVWFSYKTPIAFQMDGEFSCGERIVRQNDWSTTTGKHLNAIDGGNKKARVSGADFERLYADAINGH